jgi:hypothetical protein
MKSIWLVVDALLLSFLNTLLINVIKKKFPRFYFSLGELVVTEKEDISIGGLITKFAPPILISFFVGLFAKESGFELTLLFGFFASFLVIWPVVLSGNELLSWEAKKKIRVLYLIYFFYIVTYVLFSLLGYWIGISTSGIKTVNYLSLLIDAYPTWPPLVQGVVSNAISALIIALLGAISALAYKRLFKVLWKKIKEERRKNEEQK